MSRAARAVIDLSALRHNFHQVQRAAPGCQVLAVVKSDAYGHGAATCARALQEADQLGVACLEEAVELREAGITAPILLLEGFFEVEELADIRRLDLQLVVHRQAQIDALATLPPGTAPLRVWLKVDTGMHRLGFGVAQAAGAWHRLAACPAVAEPPGLMTHLACADARGSEATRAQLALFETLHVPAEVPRSVANSAAVLAWPQAHADLVRPGIMLYGASPFAGETAGMQNLRPVMTLRTRLMALHRCRRGEAVGYGGDWVCPQDMPVGVAAIGYGDGYPRHAPAGTPVLVDGHRVALIGRVSMDMICLDLRALPEAAVGDEVVLWGDELPAEEVAAAAGTIAYELFCGVSRRVPREYQHARD